MSKRDWSEVGLKLLGVYFLVLGFAMTILGALLGGALVMRYGIMRPLVPAAFLIASTNLLFALLAVTGHDIVMLAVVISADNITGGLAGSVFIAYLSSLTSANYTATQYALFSSLMTLPGKIIGGFSGLIAVNLGLQVAADGSVLNPDAYAYFFVYVAVIGIPSVLLAFYLMRVERGRAADHPGKYSGVVWSPGNHDRERGYGIAPLFRSRLWENAKSRFQCFL